MFVFAATYTGHLGWWDLNNEQVRLCNDYPKTNFGHIYSIEYFEDDNALVVCGEDGIYLWRPGSETGWVSYNIATPQKREVGPFRSAKFADKKRFFASDYWPRLYSIHGNSITTVDDVGGKLAKHPSGDLLLVSESKFDVNRIRFAWLQEESVSLSPLTICLPLEYQPFGAAAFHPDGSQFSLLSSTPNFSQLLVFSFPKCRLLHTVFYRRDDVSSDDLYESLTIPASVDRIGYSSLGDVILFPTPNGMIVCVDSRTGFILNEIHSHTGAVYAFDLAGDGLVITGGYEDGLIKTWREDKCKSPAVHLDIKTADSFRDLEAQVTGSIAATGSEGLLYTDGTGKWSNIFST